MSSSATLADNVNMLFAHLLINLVSQSNLKVLIEQFYGPGIMSALKYNAEQFTHGLYLMEIPSKTKCKQNTNIKQRNKIIVRNTMKEKPNG